jgi:hypothetical protein
LLTTFQGQREVFSLIEPTGARYFDAGFLG